MVKSTMSRFRQGQLDALCGFYALTNAVCSLVNAQRSPLAELVFEEAINRAPRALFPACLTDGLERSELLTVARRAVHRLSKDHGISLDTSSFHLDLSTGEGRRAFNPATMRVIACIETLSIAPLSHWTVITRIARDHATLADSGSLKSIPFAAPRMCGSPARVLWKRSILIRRVS